MTPARFRHWERTRERRERRGVLRWLLVLALGGALAGFVAWRGRDSVSGASHAWLAGAVATFMVAFMRVPFHIYWRPDAALLAQLPIAGPILLASALRRCAAATAATLAIVLVGAIPIAFLDDNAVRLATRTLDATPIAGDTVPHLTPLGLYGHHAAFAGLFAIVAACFIPAVTVFAAAMVAGSRDLLQIATAVGGAPARREARPLQPPGTGSAGAVLGAFPGFGASVALVVILLASPWLTNHDGPLEILWAVILVGGASLISLAGAIQRVGPTMGDILRDVSALDRQRLATLEIRPPTAIERAVMKLLGAAALPYSKDARLMRRRYPMAYALGALVFLVLLIIGFSRPADPIPWLAVPLAGALVYAVLLRRRLDAPPIELPRLEATLPITPAARTRAKRAWTVVWFAVFVLVPAAFAAVRVAI